jgi:hypothetical protein
MLEVERATFAEARTIVKGVLSKSALTACGLPQQKNALDYRAGLPRLKKRFEIRILNSERIYLFALLQRNAGQSKLLRGAEGRASID